MCSFSFARETDPFRRNLRADYRGRNFVRITKLGPFHDQDTNRKGIGYRDHEEDVITIPGMASHAVNSTYNWNLTYVANPHANNRRIDIPQGKAVGGGSLLNRMVFDRGSVADYNRWETLGNKGWGWDGLLPFFKKVALRWILLSLLFLNIIALTRWRR
jgi:choline dehydrogenase-like flavoprotein